MELPTIISLKLGQVSSIHNVLYALNKPTEGAINITYSETDLTIQSPYEGRIYDHGVWSARTIGKRQYSAPVLRSRYIIGNQAIVFPKPVIKGRI